MNSLNNCDDREPLNELSINIPDPKALKGLTLDNALKTAVKLPGTLVGGAFDIVKLIRGMFTNINSYNWLEVDNFNKFSSISRNLDEDIGKKGDVGPRKVVLRKFKPPLMLVSRTILQLDQLDSKDSPDQVSSEGKPNASIFAGRKCIFFEVYETSTFGAKYINPLASGKIALIRLKTEEGNILNYVGANVQGEKDILKSTLQKFEVNVKSPTNNFMPKGQIHGAFRDTPTWYISYVISDYDANETDKRVDKIQDSLAKLFATEYVVKTTAFPHKTEHKYKGGDYGYQLTISRKPSKTWVGSIGVFREEPNALNHNNRLVIIYSTDKAMQKKTEDIFSAGGLEGRVIHKDQQLKMDLGSTANYENSGNGEDRVERPIAYVAHQVTVAVSSENKRKTMKDQFNELRIRMRSIRNTGSYNDAVKIIEMYFDNSTTKAGSAIVSMMYTWQPVIKWQYDINDSDVTGVMCAVYTDSHREQFAFTYNNNLSEVYLSYSTNIKDGKL